MKKAIDFIDEFERKLIEKKSVNTIDAYIRNIKHFIKYLEEQDTQFDDLINDDVIEYVEYLLTEPNPRTGKPLSPKSINSKLISINKYVNYLNANQEYENRIYVEIETLSVQEQWYLDNLLEYSQYLRMLKRAHDDDNAMEYMMFKALYHTGVRVSELIKIKPCHIVADDLNIINGKGRKSRKIILSDEIIEELLQYIKKHDIKENECVFDMTRQNVDYHIKRVAGKCRISLARAHAHNFRHLYALNLRDQGVPIETLGELLGHKNLNTTKIYTRQTKKELKKVIGKL